MELKMNNNLGDFGFNWRWAWIHQQQQQQAAAARRAAAAKKRAAAAKKRKEQQQAKQFGLIWRNNRWEWESNKWPTGTFQQGSTVKVKYRKQVYSTGYRDLPSAMVKARAWEQSRQNQERNYQNQARSKTSQLSSAAKAAAAKAAAAKAAAAKAAASKSAVDKASAAKKAGDAKRAAQAAGDTSMAAKLAALEAKIRGFETREAEHRGYERARKEFRQRRRRWRKKRGRGWGWGRGKEKEAAKPAAKAAAPAKAAKAPKAAPKPVTCTSGKKLVGGKCVAPRKPRMRCPKSRRPNWPSNWYDPAAEQRYLNKYADINAAVGSGAIRSGLYHYACTGSREGRTWSGLEGYATRPGYLAGIFSNWDQEYD
jgi:hypothetical protein